MIQHAPNANAFTHLPLVARTDEDYSAIHDAWLDQWGSPERDGDAGGGPSDTAPTIPDDDYHPERVIPLIVQMLLIYAVLSALAWWAL